MAMIKLTEDNFEQEAVRSDRPVLVDFWAAWCGPCKMLSPVVEEISNEVTDFKVAGCNVDDEMGLARQFRVMSIPTLVVLKEGKEVARSVGVISKEEILALVRG
ncbi:MAG: thioredoxin [Lachnospiraceae bacterium]|nr:thioredoxin [Lachnospiraceae bacterium]